MKQILILIFIFSSGLLSAQEIVVDTSSVTVHKDWRIDEMVSRQLSLNTTARRAAGKTMRGYRLLVLNTNSRDEAIAAKTKVYTYFPELKSYMQYQTPFFKLKAGNFQTRDEAARYRELMNNIFPKGVFIINDTIEVKPEKDELD